MILIFIAAYILEAIWLRMRHSNQAARTSRAAASILGIIVGFIGAEHGYFEVLNRDKDFNGILFDAISGTSFSNLPTSQWTGWPVITLIQSFLITGIFAILVSMRVMAWAAMVVQGKNGGLTLILLSTFMLLGLRPVEWCSSRPLSFGFPT